MARANGAEARQASVKRAEFRACAVALVSGERYFEHFCLWYSHLLIWPEWGNRNPYLVIHSLSTHLLRSFAPFLHINLTPSVILFLGFVHVSPPNFFKLGKSGVHLYEELKKAALTSAGWDRARQPVVATADGRELFCPQAPIQLASAHNVRATYSLNTFHILLTWQTKEKFSHNS